MPRPVERIIVAHPPLPLPAPSRQGNRLITPVLDLDGCGSLKICTAWVPAHASFSSDPGGVMPNEPDEDA
jgi:hypothetical protein